MPGKPGEIKAPEFWKRFYEKAAGEEVPFKASFELTHGCNLHCRHCYIVKRPDKKELGYEEICSILDQLSETGCFHLDLTGGEVFTRADTLNILSYAKTKGFYVILLTNATLITPEIADYLKEMNINQIEISLYGATAKTYEAITRTPGSFSRCLEGINLLRQRKINIMLKMPVMTLNIEEVGGVRRLAERLGIYFRYGWYIHPRLDGSREPLSFRISPEEVLRLEKNSGLHMDNKEVKFVKEKTFPRNDSLFYCDAGRNSLAITPYGEMNLCLESCFPGYDLRGGDLASKWRELVAFVKSAKPDNNYQCNACHVRDYCSWCPAEGRLYNKDMNACVPYLKQLAELRMERAKQAT